MSGYHSVLINRNDLFFCSSFFSFFTLSELDGVVSEFPLILLRTDGKHSRFDLSDQ